MVLPSLKWNTLANYLGLIYAIVISIVIFPFYLQYLGAEAVGLIGFFTILQSWLQLLDMGMSPMLSRQVAQARGQQQSSFVEIRKLVRSLELIFFGIAIIIILSVTISSEWLSIHWLKVNSLNLTTINKSIILMGIILALRLLSSLYRSGIQGLEKQVWLNILNSKIVTLRFVGALLLLIYITHDIFHFFIYQLLIGVIELIILNLFFYHSLPSKNEKIGLHFFWDNIKPSLPFAGGIAYTAGLWILLTQLDKTILSSILSLSNYGYFALVVIVSTGITQLASPISQALLPRMTTLLSANKEEDMLALYRTASQVMAIIIFPLSGLIALFSSELLYAWTGDNNVAKWGGEILMWYALGNGILAISAFQYYLQYAHGKLKMHVIYSSISAFIQIPIIIYAALKFGAIGVAFTWFILRVITFFIWTPIVHNKFAPNLHWVWFMKDIIPIFLSTAVSLLFIKFINVNLSILNRVQIIIALATIGLLIILINIVASGILKDKLFTILKKIYV